MEFQIKVDTMIQWSCIANKVPCHKFHRLSWDIKTCPIKVLCYSMSTNVVISNSISALKTIYFRKNHSPLISLVLVKLMQQIVRKYGSKLKFVNFCGHICFYLILKIAIKGITNSYKFQLQIWFIRGMSLNKFSHPLVH